MTRMQVFPNPALKLFEAYDDFSGGLNSEISNERLKDNEFPTFDNVDLLGRGSAKRRTGRVAALTTQIPAGTAQGMFFYYHSDGSQPDILAAVSGSLYLIASGSTTATLLTITGLPGNATTFQSTRPVEAIQYGNKLYIATGTALVQYDGTSASAVTPYTPTAMEAIYVGLNGLASDPSAYVQDGTAGQLQVSAIAPGVTTGSVNNATNLTAYTNHPSYMTALAYQWAWRLTGQSTFTNGGTGKTWSFTPSVVQNLDFQVTVSAPIADPTSAPSASVSGSGSSLTATSTYVGIDYRNDSLPVEGSTQASTVAQAQTKMSPTYNVTPSAGQNIVATVTLPTNTNAVGVYVGTTSSPLLLGVVNSAGGITYSGSASSGLAVSVSGSTLTITISAVASASGAAAVSTNSTQTGIAYVLSNYEVDATQAPGALPVSGIQTCTHILLHYDRLLMYGDTTNPFQLYVSQIENPAYWPEDNTLNFDTGKREPITAIVHFRDILAVFTETTIQLLEGTGPDNYNRILINDTWGAVSGRTVQTAENDIIFLSHEGIFKLVPNLYVPTAPTIQRVDYQIRSAVPRTDTGACALVHNDQYWICFPSEGYVFRYYYDMNVWVRDTSPNSFLTFNQFLKYEETVYNLRTNGELHQHSKTVYDDSGNVYNMYVESKYFDLDAAYNYKKLRRIYVMAQSYTDGAASYSVSVVVDGATIMDATGGYVNIDQATGNTTWVETGNPNFVFSVGSTLGQWVLGKSPLQSADLQVILATLSTKKCRRVKVVIQHSESSLAEVFGIGLEFKLRKPY